MSYLRFQDEDESSAAGTVTSVLLGAVAGFAVGMLVAQRVGGLSGLANRVRGSLPDVGELAGSQPVVADDYADYDDYEDDELEASGEGSELEERVLEAFRNDPILSERAIDIGAIDEGIVELTGWVNADDESQQAVVVARGVPGVETVVNRLAVRAEEDLFDELADRYADGDPSLTEGQWEGQSVGTGRRRQGSSAEVDRHEDPRPELEEAVLDKVFLDADEVAEIKAERRARPKAPRGGRADGSPIAPSGVPKSDHVADPLSAPNTTAQGE